MTVGIVIKCKDGLVVASDSLATFGRGVSVSKYMEKIHVIEHDSLLFPVVIVGSGATAFVDKFRDRAVRKAIPSACRQLSQKNGIPDIKLDIIDFADYVCEPLVMTMFKEYAIDRSQFLGLPGISNNYSLGIIIAGATITGDYRAFFVHFDGLTENVHDYGTIGSGAAYAELFLRELAFLENGVTVQEAASFAAYAVKGAELMDPNVGGHACVKIIKIETYKKDDQEFKELSIEEFSEAKEFDDDIKKEMIDILKGVGQRTKQLVKTEDKSITKKEPETTNPTNGDTDENAA